MSAPIERDTLIDALRALARLARVEFLTTSLADAADTFTDASEFEIEALRTVEAQLLQPLDEAERN